MNLISKAFEKRHSRYSYLKKMHESLTDCSERTQTDVVYHTSMIELEWEIQRYQNESMRG